MGLRSRWLGHVGSMKADRMKANAQIAAERIVERLRAEGFDAYFAGGCVRDLLLGQAPVDFDVATSARPEIVLDLFPRTFAVGAHFGVVLVADEIQGEQIVTEVATFRNDGSYSDGRRPDRVSFSTDAREDVLRRDFTINGMLLIQWCSRKATTRKKQRWIMWADVLILRQGWCGRLVIRRGDLKKINCGCYGLFALQRGLDL